MNSIFFVSPALVLCAGSLFVLLAGLWINNNVLLVSSTIGTLVVSAGLYLGMIGKPSQEAFAGLLTFDPLGLFFALFAIFSVFIATVMSANSAEIRQDRRPEYFSILLALTSGLIFMGISSHLLMIYLALETVSILSYTLAGFARERTGSVEASMKYVVYGSIASAIFVFGMSLLFGVVGGLQLDQIRTYVSTTPVDQIPSTLWVAVLFIFAGIGYKISAAPMHMWTPDVYEGAPTAVSGLFSVAPKAAGFALLIRFFVTGFTMPVAAGSAVITATANASDIAFHIVGPFNWPQFLMYSSVFTMFMGNLAALGQISVKRILAYSSIAHAGYILMGATTQTSAGLYAMLFYISVYCLMNLGAFWVTSKVDETMGGDHLKHFRGLGQRKPYYAAMMAIFLFSLVGLPPFAGFLGKWYLFSAIIAREMYGFALIAAINSVISLYFYVKIIRAMFLDQPELKFPEGKTAFDSFSSKAFLALLALPNVALVLYWEPLLDLAKGAISLFVKS